MTFFTYLLMTLLGFSGLFLIALILLQRGRGGGLAGAFGGMGGQSAFGTKAGDVFTRITVVIASIWILLCAGSVLALQHSQTSLVDKGVLKQGSDSSDPVKKASPKDDATKDDGAAPAKTLETPMPPLKEQPDSSSSGGKANDKKTATEEKTAPQSPANNEQPAGTKDSPATDGEKKPEVKVEAPKADEAATPDAGAKAKEGEATEAKPESKDEQPQSQP